MMKQIAVFSAIALSSVFGPSAPLQLRAAPLPEVRVQPASVELLSPGTGNREPLRFKPAVNSKQQVVMTLDQQSEVTVGGSRLPSLPIPATQVTIETVITQVDPNGDIHYQFRYVDIQVQPQPGAPGLPPIAELQSELAKLKGIQGTAVMDAQGRTQSSSLTVADTVDAKTQQQFKQLFESTQQAAVPLPDAAIGIGAKWRASSPLTITGIKVDQTIIYELVDLKAGQAAIAFRLEQQAAPQPVPTLTPAPHVKAMLQSYSAQGTGQSTIDLTEPFKIRTQTDLRQVAQLNLEDSQSTQKTEFGMTIHSKLAIEPK